MARTVQPVSSISMRVGGGMSHRSRCSAWRGSGGRWRASASNNLANARAYPYRRLGLLLVVREVGAVVPPFSPRAGGVPHDQHVGVRKRPGPGHGEELLDLGAVARAEGRDGMVLHHGEPDFAGRRQRPGQAGGLAGADGLDDLADRGAVDVGVGRGAGREPRVHHVIEPAPLLRPDRLVLAELARVPEHKASKRKDTPRSKRCHRSARCGEHHRPVTPEHAAH